MTTLMPIIASNPLIVSATATTPATLANTVDVSPVRPASLVSLGNPPADVVDIYSRDGQIPGRESVRAWENSSQDAVTKIINASFNSISTASRYSGLGAALVAQFTQGGGAGISQSVLNTTADRAGDASALKTDQAVLHNKADNQVSLSIKTASGKIVTFSLSSQKDGLGVQATVEGGDLTADELKAVGQLGSAFQASVDGLTAVPPKLDLSQLTQFDSKVLASVDLNAKVTSQGNDDLTLAFHADSQSRTTRMSGPAGSIDLAVDLKNPAIFGDAKQQANALKTYLAQFDRVEKRGSANADLMAMFKDAFSAMNSNYPQSAAVDALSNNPSDKGLLTGLADFKASIKQAVDSSNSMRPSEVDSFSYNVSQKTQVNGRSSADRSVTQNQQSVLSASFHKGLDGGKPPVFDGSRESQNYLYVEVQDRASSTASLAYQDGQLTRASVTQVASQNTHTQKYVMANLVEDTVVPKDGSSKRDYLALLEHAGRESKKSKDALEQSTLKDALVKMHDSVLLQDDPDVLTR
ncbi:lactate dehydrogenase [Pseudomonas extremaustralis]|uniref:lactate dehydrogenase n=1 Tax=Pseudomonas extremaustralis TaxID=359110 RepID=UPI00240F92F0|nr:lactate dehydrogenase [Pseudomonas extremaustralis]MDG2966763.1 lactate dehydrogenase [Pseudomonas extremaustralis]